MHQDSRNVRAKTHQAYSFGIRDTLHRVGSAIFLAGGVALTIACSAALYAQFLVPTKSTTEVATSTLPDSALLLLSDTSQTHIPLSLDVSPYPALNSDSCDLGDWSALPASLNFPLWSAPNKPMASLLLQAQEIDGALVVPTPRLLILLAVAVPMMLYGLWRSKSYQCLRSIALFSSATASMIAVGIWSLTGALSSGIVDSHQFERYKSASSHIAQLYEWLWPLAWEEDPYPALNTHIISTGIVNALKDDDVLLAARLASFDTSNSTRFLRATANYRAAQSMFDSGHTHESVAFTKEFFEIVDPNSATPFSHSVTTALAYQFAASHAFADALELLVKNPDTWESSSYSSAWATVLRENLISLRIDETEADQLGNSYANVSAAYLLSAANYSNKRLPETARCIYASSLQEIGRASLLKGDDRGATRTLEVADKHVADDDLTHTLLVSAAHQRGVRQYKEGKNFAAIRSLDYALGGDIQNEQISCDLSAVAAETANDLAALGDFDELAGMEKLLNRVEEELCRPDNYDVMIANFYLILGQQALKNGKFEIATEMLHEAIMVGVVESTELAEYFLADIDAAKVRLDTLRVAGGWVESMPRVTGSLCVIKEETARGCSEVQLFDGLRPVGLARGDMSDLAIHTKDFELVLSDSTGNGAIDTADYSEPSRRRVIVEKDGDYRLDGELLFDENGALVESTVYSGQVLIRIPSGAIREPQDIFSAPDAYLGYWKNDTHLGWSETYENSNFPIWQQGFVVHMRRGDEVIIRMFDEDIGEHDYIDGWIFNRLPTSGVYNSYKYKAVIEMIVTPTTLPEGAYDITDSEIVNMFEHANFENPNIASFVSQARSAHEKSNKMAKFVSWVAPEIVMFTLFSTERLAFQILGSLAASGAMESTLTSSE